MGDLGCWIVLVIVIASFVTPYPDRWGKMFLGWFLRRIDKPLQTFVVEVQQHDGRGRKIIGSWTVEASTISAALVEALARSAKEDHRHGRT